MTAQRFFYASVLAFLIARVYLALTSSGLWGVDGGAYFLSALHVAGKETTGTDFLRPPFAPGWLLVPFVTAFGNDIGLKLFSIACTIAILPAFYLFVSLWLKGWPRTIVMIAFMADWQLAEMWTAGALPMIGFSFLLLILWAMLRGKKDTGSHIIYVICPASIALTNQTSVGVSAILIPVSLIALATAGRKAEAWTNIKWLAVGCAIAALLAWPYYLGVAPGDSGLRYPGSLLTVYSWSNIAWWMSGYGLLTGVGLLFTRDKSVYPLAFLIFAVSVMRVLLSHDETIMNVVYRSGYLLMPLCVIAWAWLLIRYVPEFRWSQAWVKASIASVMVFVVLGWWFQVRIMSAIETQVTPDTEQAIAWLNDQDYAGSVVTNSYSMSLYVAALTEHKTAWSQVYDPPIKYRQQHEDVTCIFGWDPSCDVETAITRQNGFYLLIDRRWPADTNDVDNMKNLPSFYKDIKTVSLEKTYAYGLIWGQVHNPWALTASAPWLTKVFEQGTTIVYKVNRS